MLVPSIFGENLFDDWFDADFPQWPEFRDLDRAERKLYGRHADRLMKTDVHEHDDHYEVDIDLPGFKKEEIKLELNNGYLTVGASKEHDQTNNGKAIRKERYSGSMSRSFYIGDLPSSGIEPVSPALQADSLPLSHLGNQVVCCCCC